IEVAAEERGVWRRERVSESQDRAGTSSVFVLRRRKDVEAWRRGGSRKIWLAVTICLTSISLLSAQGRPGGAGQGAPSVGPRPGVGPADRPTVDPAAVARGTRVWAADCVTCHGPNARGSDTVPSLLRSRIVLSDRAGSTLGPLLKKGHP